MYSTNTGSVQLYVHRKVKKLQIKKLSIASVSSYVNFFLYAFYSKVLFLPKEHSLFKKIWKRKPSQDTLDSSSASTGLCLQLSLSCVHQAVQTAEQNGTASLSNCLLFIFLSRSLSVHLSYIYRHYLIIIYFLSSIYHLLFYHVSLSVYLSLQLPTIHPPSFGLNVHGPHRLMYWTLGTHLVVIFSKATELFRHVSQIVTSRCLGLGLENRYLLLALA